MKKFILFWIFVPFYFVPQRMIAMDVAFVTNGVVVAVPVQLPVVGVRLDTRQTVLNLYGADTSTLNACGYFPVQRSSETVGTNQYVAARAWAIESGKCVEHLTLSNKVVKVTLSRRKVAEAVAANGWSTQFMTFVNSSPEVAVRWYSTEKLVAGSDEMKPFIEGFASVVGMSYTNAVQILETCRE